LLNQLTTDFLGLCQDNLLILLNQHAENQQILLPNCQTRD